MAAKCGTNVLFYMLNRTKSILSVSVVAVARNIAHRDLKLENLLLAAPGDITRVRIADFGLAKRADHALTTICGTPQYVAPEVLQVRRAGKTDPWKARSPVGVWAAWGAERQDLGNGNAARGGECSGAWHFGEGILEDAS
jgi:serine/threonine protein kinase